MFGCAFLVIGAVAEFVGDVGVAGWVEGQGGVLAGVAGLIVSRGSVHIGNRPGIGRRARGVPEAARRRVVEGNARHRAPGQGQGGIRAIRAADGSDIFQIPASAWERSRIRIRQTAAAADEVDVGLAGVVEGDGHIVPERVMRRVVYLKQNTPACRVHCVVDVGVLGKYHVDAARGVNRHGATVVLRDACVFAVGVGRYVQDRPGPVQAALSAHAAPHPNPVGADVVVADRGQRSIGPKRQGDVGRLVDAGRSHRCVAPGAAVPLGHLERAVAGKGNVRVAVRVKGNGRGAVGRRGDGRCLPQRPRGGRCGPEGQQYEDGGEKRDNQTGGRPGLMGKKRYGCHGGPPVQTLSHGRRRLPAAGAVVEDLHQVAERQFAKLPRRPDDGPVAVGVEADEA